MTERRHPRRLGAALLAALVLLPAVPVAAQQPALTVAQARASVAGEWLAELQYRDYQSDTWVGIPFSTRITMVEDGVTQVRTSAYDDGPARRTVWITTTAMLGPDGATEYVGTYRADRPADHNAYRLRLGQAAAGQPFTAENWVLIAVSDGTDDDRPARIRETTTRTGATVTTLKEVDFTDDTQQTWLARNRTVLTRR